MAEELSKVFQVYLCGHNIEEGVCNGVFYHNTNHMNDLLKNNKIDVMIVSRYVHYFTEYINTAKKTLIWLHDVCPCSSLKGIEFSNSGYNIIHNINSISKIVCLSRWHKQYVHAQSGLPLNKISIIGNGFDNNDFNTTSRRIKNRFIYISEYDRSLIEVLEIFCKVKKILTDSVLHVYCNLPGSSNLRDKIKNTAEVYYHERISHNQIIKELQKSDVWLYIPSSFCETYCISALEAQRSGCICFVNDIGSLSEVVGNRGIVFDSQLNKDAKVKIILDTLNNEPLKKEKRLLMEKWAEKQTWTNRSEEWIKLFNEL